RHPQAPAHCPEHRADPRELKRYPPPTALAGGVIARAGTPCPCSTRMIVTEPAVVSPVGVIAKLPMIPLRTRVANSARVTDARVPSERAIASSRTSAAWAP